MTLKISVGTKNPAKMAAVERAVKKIWPQAKVTGVEVQHGTSIQPRSDGEAIEGATKRAKLSLKETGTDIGVGLEGSTAEDNHGMYLTGWVVAVDKKGTVGVGGCGRVLLPEKVATEIRKGRELGPVMDELVGETDIKRKQGAVGILTNGLVNRTDNFEQAVIYALAKFYNSKYYG